MRNRRVESPTTTVLTIMEVIISLKNMVNGQQVVVGSGEKTVVILRARVLGRVSDLVSIYGMGEVPISKARRFNARASVGLTLDF